MSEIRELIDGNWTVKLGHVHRESIKALILQQYHQKEKGLPTELAQVANEAASVGGDGGAGVESSGKLKLYSYWRSSCSCRVRIGLNLKGIEYEYKAVHLLKGEQRSPEYLKLNPVGFVPALVDGDIVLADSFAILMYLEEKFPERPLLPKDLQKRAINYQAANIVASGIQPYQNIPILKFMKEKFGPDEDVAWARDHIRRGFAALEKLLKDHAGKYATGDEVFLADLFLAPQVDGAIRRFNVDMNEFPTLLRIYEAYSEIPAFRDAMPGKQPDTPPEHRD
ncbi:OLC1v1038781C1 [Oldenlandia corymbosa var. corymbosa]|uniref:glutathione transferase n=1 Tax=Oldenlandia corymbosa var. corymbosa TaxID=529605 RepID=A0AAV1D254_OLDCO|nr:OLC1v1038781C1 [Oldenlandia corymbosa var. corymbosa]